MILAVAAAGLLLPAGCRLTPRQPPFRYLEVGVETGNERRCTAEIALRIELENTVSTAIETFEATAYLYVGKKPRVVEWENSLPVSAGETRAYCLDVADAVPAGATDVPVVDLVHIHRVSLADGTVWRDPLAAYVWRREGVGEGGNAE